MAINIENHSIFIKNSKLILGSIASVDRKRRTYEVISLDSKKNSFGFKDLIYDLEDAVAPAAKDQARLTIISLVNSNQNSKKEQVVRLNSDDNEFGKKDYEVLEKCEPDAILIPKVNAPEDVLKLIASGSLLEDDIVSLFAAPD